MSDTTTTTTTTTDLLGVADQQALDRCEAVIARGVQTFIEVGEALAEIRKGKLYRAEHRTFEDYCRDRWGIGRGRAYQLMGAAEIAGNLSTIVDILPANEAQARPLAGLPPEQQRQAWQQASASTDGKPTAKAVQQAVEQITSPPAPFWQSMSPAHQTAHLWTRTGMYSYRAACGMTAQRAPAGRTEAGHCSSCVRATWNADKVEPPADDVTDRLERMEDQAEYNDAHTDLIVGQRSDPHQPDPAEPPPADPSSSWTAAQYAELARADQETLALAETEIERGNVADARQLLERVQVVTARRDHLLARLDPIPVFPALTALECKALIREAKDFIERGADRRWPTIGHALRIAARMALEATE